LEAWSVFIPFQLKALKPRAAAPAPAAETLMKSLLVFIQILLIYYRLKCVGKAFFRDSPVWCGKIMFYISISFLSKIILILALTN
jgi:hypothetical protein